MKTFANFQLLWNNVNVPSVLSFHSLGHEVPDGVSNLPNAAFDEKGALTRKPQLTSPYYT